MAKRLGSGRLAAILILILAVVSLFSWKRDYAAVTLKLDRALVSAINERGLDAENPFYEAQEEYKSGRHLLLKITRHYEVEADFDAVSFLSEIRKLSKKSGFELAKSLVEKGVKQESLLIALSFRGRILYELKFLRKRAGYVAAIKSKGAKIAIVLDDFGYNMNNVEALFEIKSPLTISVLPDLPYSKKIADELRGRNFETMLHLPLEPHSEELNLEKGTIMVDMAPREVRDLLAKAMDGVPGLKGVSNHMGSRATEDKALMSEIFTELKKRDLYFFDNLVTDKSICKEVAGKVGLRIATRSVFLDNESGEEYIERQILETADLAESTGWAVGVGHDKSVTIKVLAKVIPRLREAGFQFVYVSELVR